MSDFADRLKELEQYSCVKCWGSGEVNDAGFGDIYYKSWTCPDCKGTGYEITTKEIDESQSRLR